MSLTSPHSRRFLALPCCLALAGVLFSLWNLLGDSSALCVTEGCALFQDFTIAGISLWWLGFVGFACLFLAAIPGLAGLGLFMATTGLILDAVLLLIMLATAPCFNCLLIGLLLALTFLAYRAAWREGHRRRPTLSFSSILAIWGLLFLLNSGVVANSLFHPWALPGTQKTADGAVQVYFSPSCSACLELVQQASANNGSPLSNSIAWHAVAENSRDILVIHAMKNRMSAGEPLASALRAALEETPAAIAPQQLITPALLRTQYRLWRNKAHLLKNGSDRLPYLEFRGLPAFLSAPASSGDDTANGSTAGATLPFLEVSAFCDGSEEPCDDAPSLPDQSLRDLMNLPE